MFCPKCGNKLQDNAKFCSSCGNQISTENISKPAEQKVDRQAVWSESFNSSPPAQTPPPYRPPVAPQQPKKKGLQWWHILLIVLGALIILISVIAAIGSSNDNSNGGYSGGSYNYNYDDNSSSQDENNNNTLAKPKIGDVIKFGSYEQDANSSNGDEAVEWIILDSVDGKLLLMSKYALDACEYAWDENGCSWFDSEPCDVLNRMYHDMFSYREKKKINGNLTYESIETYYGDRYVFALSSEEIEEYSTKLNQKLSLCYPTKYAIAEGIKVSEDHDTYPGCVSWWTESDYRYGTVMLGDSGVGWVAQSYSERKSGVRPVIWVDEEYMIDTETNTQISSQMLGTWVVSEGSDEHTITVKENGEFVLVDGPDTVTAKYVCYSPTEIALIGNADEDMNGYVFVLSNNKLYRYPEYDYDETYIYKK